MNTIYITLKRQELLDDIRQYAYVAGHNAVVKDDGFRHMVQDVTNGRDSAGAAHGGIIITTRMLNLAWARCLGLLKDYTDLNATDETASASSSSTTSTTTTERSDAATDGVNLDDGYGEPETYRVALRVGTTFTRGQHILLKNLMHKFLVYAALTEWLTLTLPDLAAAFEAKTAAVGAEIQDVATSMGTSLRIVLHPF